MPLLDALSTFKGLFGIPAGSSIDLIDVRDSSSDGSFHEMLTTLGSVGGQRGDSVIQNDNSGIVQSSTAKTCSRPNGEAGSESSSAKDDDDDDDEDEASSRRVRP
jgi:hypothetical protein